MAQRGRADRGGVCAEVCIVRKAANFATCCSHESLDYVLMLRSNSHLSGIDSCVAELNDLVKVPFVASPIAALSVSTSVNLFLAHPPLAHYLGQ